MNSRRHILSLLLLLLTEAIFFASCNHTSRPKMFDPAQVNFQASYNPIFSNCLYPSVVLGMANFNGATESDMQQLFSIEVTAPKDNSVLRIQIDSSSLSYVTYYQEVLEKKGQRYTFHPNIKWKYDQLYATRKQGSIDLTFTCYINDEEVDLKNLRINYRSVNECLLSAKFNGKVQDFRWLFAGYVNEDHPKIDEILSEILTQGIVTSFTGYQSKKTATVKKQVEAIWNYALNRGIAYSSISCTSNPSNNANVQHIRFFDEVYSNRQANCIDACVFFASIMRKIGLKPIIFVEPCHAYLGYYTDSKRKNIELLETTITGWVNFPDVDKSIDPSTGRPSEARLQTIAKYLTEQQKKQYEQGKMSLEDVKLAVSDSLFRRATDYNKERHQANLTHFQDSSAITYQQLVIEDLRKVVQPIN